MHYAFAQNTFVAPTPPGSSALRESVATATMFYLCESVATATTNVFCSESKAAATIVLSVRKRSVSNKAPSRNGNQPHVMVMSQN
ncbi:hypothetical protein FJQ98_19605 [Lysinibacillus agricola]|uniref:Uncharacterized protein n=1 Tax=Lysinibacillus agricola TaxID=2590012 RepID=A0ABX7APE5_9BACI|nr:MULTISPECIES: hypothetical protein [Lysinibacillus]QQP11396.1 hypothetical protein FJQ98_19605 [Lysinibacillus agricola]